MGTNSALICRRVIDNAYQVLAILYMALAQATDILNIQSDLAPATQQAYKEIRTLTQSRTDDMPFYEDLERIITFLKNKI